MALDRHWTFTDESEVLLLEHFIQELAPLTSAICNIISRS
ncbi:conserved hypothetical protein [Verticillium alfalfae VaMs.102]|uniref:Uncharacterized protein n=1 Tax=Verticillium alfalfae (strain VaMs.102 / ATCC MYA-4576 / FGSC 10136) TaxID=526221 RepID=C9SET1_VERA1|nr:conserved hypothetical protein [Verticillium alfalfae VaMs.102]EEY16674.1 conserved hypothetical protein [Verticillium alfalfae VaMs.102]